MHSTNRRCNALQSLVGIFLHSCGAPETVREFLARIGLSISVSTINEAVNYLSQEAGLEIEKEGQTLLTSYAYDNLDINLKHTTPRIEQSGDTLVHLTTATMLPLRGGITTNDLNCAEAVWKHSSSNVGSGQSRRTISMDDLRSIHKELATPHPSGLQTRQQRFNAGKFLSNLVEYGPEYFRQFQGKLEEPEVVDGLLPEKTTQLPMKAMDIKPDTPTGNAEVVKEIFTQSSVGDPAENSRARNIENHVVLVFGDLGTGQHLRSLMESRSEDTTAWNRLQAVVFVMGLFHLKMACADAIWKIFIDGGKSRKMDPNSLINHVGEIRPKETGKIETKPTFRQMHEVIQHVGIVMHLDAWRVAAGKHHKKDLASLEDYAKLEPKWEDIILISHDLCRNYVARKTDDLSRKRKQSTAQRDQQQENTQLQMQYFLLYEQMSHGLNHGDIGRIESLFVPWMSIFRGCGKHKYAAELKRYLENVHFIYPEGLRRAIRKNILCNPTGKKDSFRGIDWLVEHNNLYIKCIYGGSFSNHTVGRILTESPLLETFKIIRHQFEKWFCLDHRTTRHSPPRMAATFTKLAQYMKKQKTNEYVAGRTTQHNIPDTMTKGMSIYLKETSEETHTTDDNNGDAGEKDLESRLGLDDGDDLDGL